MFFSQLKYTDTKSETGINIFYFVWLDNQLFIGTVLGLESFSLFDYKFSFSTVCNRFLLQHNNVRNGHGGTDEHAKSVGQELSTD